MSRENHLEYWIILRPCESCRDLALLTVSICSDHYQLSCLSRFLSFFFSQCEMSPPEPYVTFSLITSNSPCLYSHPILSPASLSFILNETSMLPHPKQHTDSSVTVPHVFMSPLHTSFSPSVIDLMTGRCVMSCSSHLYLPIVNKPDYTAGESPAHVLESYAPGTWPE